MPGVLGPPPCSSAWQRSRSSCWASEMPPQPQDQGGPPSPCSTALLTPRRPGESRSALLGTGSPGPAPHLLCQSHGPVSTHAPLTCPVLGSAPVLADGLWVTPPSPDPRSPSPFLRLTSVSFAKKSCALCTLSPLPVVRIKSQMMSLPAENWTRRRQVGRTSILPHHPQHACVCTCCRHTYANPHLHVHMPWAHSSHADGLLARLRALPVSGWATSPVALV